MTDQGILDTRTLILLGRITQLDILPDEAFITAITLAELSVGPLVANNEQDRAARQAHLQAALTYDAMIAAIALANGMPVYTCNPSAFLNIDGLRVVAVPHPDNDA